MFKMYFLQRFFRESTLVQLKKRVLNKHIIIIIGSLLIVLILLRRIIYKVRYQTYQWVIIFI